MNGDPSMFFVAWQHPVARQFHVVGRLRKVRENQRDMYEFVYVQGARRAHDFRGFLAFPQVGAAYRSNELFPFFANRIVRSTRSDYPAYIDELGLTREDATPERILSRSGGTRMTDHVEIFAPPEYDPESGLHEMFFLLRGLRYMPPGTEERISTLTPGTQLYCMLDFQNAYNAQAMIVRTDDHYLLGYVPDYLAEDFNLLRGSNVHLVVLVERVNPPPAPQGHRLLCRLQAQWPANHAPFSDERFQPLVLPVEESVRTSELAETVRS